MCPPRSIAGMGQRRRPMKKGTAPFPPRAQVSHGAMTLEWRADATGVPTGRGAAEWQDGA